MVCYLVTKPQVALKFYAPLERWVGKKEIVVHASTIEESFLNVGDKIGKSLLNHLIDQKTATIKSHYHILFNGLDIESLEGGIKTKIEKKSVIVVVPPIGGG